MSHLNLQDQLISDLILALTSRRTSPGYSTSYYWNQRVLVLARTLLETSNSSLSKLLRRIIHNATWFQSHYRASLSTLQQVQAQEAAVSKRKELAATFEQDRSIRLEIGAMVEAQAGRQEVELRAVARSRLGPNTSLKSHPIENVERLRQELQFRLTPPQDLILQLEAELDIQEKLRAGRGTVVEGVDEDMILNFWAANLET